MNDLTRGSILVVDDTPANLRLLSEMLEERGYRVRPAPNGKLALGSAKNDPPDLVLLDIMMPEMDGYEVCRQLKEDEHLRDIPVIFISALTETFDKVRAFGLGGVDYIAKPFEEEEVVARVETHLKISRLTRELVRKNTDLTLEIARREQAEDALQKADEHLSILSEQEAERWGIAGFVAQSRGMADILEEIRKLQAAGTTSVLVTGESGTGKELIARAIHYGGLRAENAFIPVNCTTIPYELAESALFGHVRGAFTGADADRKGYFELADGGTLFLDEIGEMPVELQPKLLRVLEEGCFLPVGGTHEICVDVRIVAATNRDIEAKMAEGTFREDLYYRLARFIVNIPPLRERPEDIPLLAAHFLVLFAAEMGLKVSSLSDEALAELESHRFPGNVRELKNMIERALIQSGGGEIRPGHLYARGGASSHEVAAEAEAAGMEPGSRVPLNLKEAEAMLIQQALEQADGNMSEAARLLGIGRKTLYRKVEGADGRRQTADETGCA